MEQVESCVATGEKVIIVLKKMKKEGKIKGFMFPEYLKNSDDGIDFFMVYYETSPCEKYWVPIQIKISAEGQMAHKKENPDIPSLKVDPLGLSDMLEEKIMKVIERFKFGDVKAIHV